MNWRYIAAFSAMWLSGYHYQRALRSPGLQPGNGPGMTLFHACGLVSVALLVVLLVGGFILGGSWWQPVVTFVVAVAITAGSVRVLSTRMLPG